MYYGIIQLIKAPSHAFFGETLFFLSITRRSQAMTSIENELIGDQCIVLRGSHSMLNRHSTWWSTCLGLVCCIVGNIYTFISDYRFICIYIWFLSCDDCRFYKPIWMRLIAAYYIRISQPCSLASFNRHLISKWPLKKLKKKVKIN